MSQITIPYHLTLPPLLCIILLILISVKWKKNFKKSNRKWIGVSLIVFLSSYLLIVGSAAIEDIYYQWNTNKYDLNQDGFWAGEEITQEQQNAVFKLTNDLGRNLSVVTGLIFASIVTIPTALIATVKYKRK